MSARPMSDGPGISSSLLEEGTVLRLLLDRPKGNVLTKAMMEALAETLASHEGLSHLKLVMIVGAGSNFSYGASIEEHRREHAAGMLAAFHSLARQVAAYPVPVAALVQGSCLGGAFELVLCCHFVFAASGATFGCPEIRLGVYPPVLAAIGAQRLGGLVSERLLLTGSLLDAETAHRAGFIAELEPSSANLEESVLAWYRKQLKPLSAFALRQGTRAARAGSGLLTALAEPLAKIERQYVEEVIQSHDGSEGIAAFLERRNAVWEDA